MTASGDTPSFISVAAIGNTASLIAAASLEESAQINQHLTTLRMRLKTRLADKRWSIFTNYEALGIKNTMDWFKSLGFTTKASKVTVIDLSMLAHEVLPFICATIGRVLLEEGSIAAQHEQEPANETTKSKKDETDEALAFYTLWLMAFTGILAFATIGLGGATILLYATGEKQFRFAIRSGIRQSRDMQASIAAAAEANRISREGLQATQRAWISEESVISSDLIWGESGGQITIKTTIKNIGNVPAQDAQVGVSIFPVSQKRPALNDIIAVSKDRAAMPGRSQIGQMLFPNEKHTQNSRVTITPEQIEEFWNEVAVEPGARKPIFANVAVVVHYLSAMDRKDSRTIRYYNLQRIPEQSEGVSFPLAVNVNENVRQDRLLLTHFWMPSYAD
jgi:hypothetical protein